jgi:peptidoglycan-associated lipoprotein
MTRKWIALSAAAFLLAACTTADDDAATRPTAGIGGPGANGAGAGIGATDLPGQARPGTQEDLEVNVGDRVFFATDSSQLDAEAQATLQRQAAWLRQFPNILVTFEGHADERGTREYNLALGQRRADSARNYLVALGIEPYRVRTTSYGKERPVDPASNEQAWSRNRRAVTVVELTN